MLAIVTAIPVTILFSMTKIRLNCDLGEGFGIYQVADEAAIMPLIDQANIACGFHAGDAVIIQQSIELAIQHKVAIGAHPSYPDRQGFGRRSMALSAAELRAMLNYQISAVSGMARHLGGEVSYVKPHGALYNDMLVDKALRDTVFTTVRQLGQGKLSLMMLAGSKNQDFTAEADKIGLNLLFEAFADRRYTDDGKLTPRAQSDAVLNHTEALQQAVDFANGKADFHVDSLCVHGDTADALRLVQDIRRAIDA